MAARIYPGAPQLSTLPWGVACEQINTAGSSSSQPWWNPGDISLGKQWGQPGSWQDMEEKGPRGWPGGCGDPPGAAAGKEGQGQASRDTGRWMWTQKEQEGAGCNNAVIAMAAASWGQRVAFRLRPPGRTSTTKNKRTNKQINPPNCSWGLPCCFIEVFVSRTKIRFNDSQIKKHGGWGMAHG